MNHVNLFLIRVPSRVILTLSLISSPTFLLAAKPQKGASNCRAVLAPQDLQTRDLMKTLQIDHIFSFEELDANGRKIENVSLSEDGKRLAFAHSTYEDAKVEVYDLTSKTLIFHDSFTRVKSIHFIPGSDLIAIDGTLKSDGKVARLYLRSMSEKQKSPVQLVNSTSQNSAALARTTFLNPLTFWTTALTKAPVEESSHDTLKLPGSPYWGVGVEQIVARADLQYVFVAQDSSNALGDVALPNAPRGVYPKSSLLNQGITYFDATTLKPKGSLEYNGLTPIRMNLHSQTQFAALSLVDPIVAHVQNGAVVIVDSQKPNQALYRYDFKNNGVEVQRQRYVTKFPNDVTTHWNQTGDKLLLVEKTTGTIVQFDLKTKKEILSERTPEKSWSLIDAIPLHDGKILVLRKGMSPAAPNQEVSVLAGFIVEDLKDLNDQLKPDFISRIPSFELNEQMTDQLFEMQDGQTWAVFVAHHVIMIDRQTPSQQTLITADQRDQTKYRWRRPISVQKLDESTLRLIDREQGVFEIKMN